MTVGKTKDAGWQIGVSRTIHVAESRVWEFLTSADGVAIWLGTGVHFPLDPGDGYATTEGIVGEVRSFHPHDRIRLTWRPTGGTYESTVQVAIRGTVDKTMVRFHQERLDGPETRAAQRQHWESVLDRIVSALA